MLTDHIVEGDSVNHQVSITVCDEPGQGGAHHEYDISWGDYDKEQYADACHIRFQNGPIKEFGVNGITQEALLAVVIDRLRGFQSGPFACLDNELALDHCQEALSFLQRRTRERIQRGVEGRNVA